MMMSEMQVLKKLEALTLRREELQKKQMMAFRSGANQQLMDQLAMLIEQVDFEIFNYSEIRKSFKEDNDEDDGLII